MLRLKLFGGFALAGDDGAPVVIASRKCRALLAYLALQPRPEPRERLAGLLWGDGPEARARGSLRQALTTLRRELPGDGAWLDATAEAVAIDRRGLWVDAREADELLRAGEIERAIELCAAGALLAGLGAVAPEFDDWRDAEARRWRERETAALRAVADQARAAGRGQELLAVGRRLLKLEPWNEEAHRAVMQALAALGRHSEALRQYQVATEALRAELGVAPGPDTERLMLQVRAQRSGARAEPAAAGAPLAAVAPAPEVSSPPPPPSPAASDGGPVGREAEVRQIEGLLHGCRASGRGHVILIRGEAGMGKSTLLRQALERAAAGGLGTHLVAASEYGAGRSLDVVRAVLEALEAEAGPSPDHRLPLDELRGAPLDAGAAAVAAALDPAARAQAHAHALEDLVARAGALRFRVLAVEDLHWCDAETARALCTVAAAGPQHRTVVIFTCRSGEEPSDLAWAALVRRGAFTSIDLGPLPREDAAALVARYPQLAPDVARRCLERAAGHPLFLLQLLDSGGAGDAVPGSVQAAVVARLGRVAPADRRVLDAAAVIAAPFTAPEMASLLEQESVDPTALVQQGWLQLQGATRLAMGHDLLATAVRSALDEPALARLHRRAAAWFAARDPLTSAEHLERAGDPGAAAAYLSVARQALEERRLDLADTVLARVDACPAEAGLLFEAVCLRGDVRRERGDAAGSHAVFAQAAGRAGAPAEQVRARLGMAAALRLLDRHDEALRCLAEADALAATDDQATRAQLEQLRGNLLFATGNLAGCRAAHQRALAHARAAESAPDEAAALSGIGDAHYLEGRVTSATGAFEASCAIARAHGILRMEAASATMLGMTALYAADVPAAQAAVARACELAATIGHPRLVSLAEDVAAFVARERGDLATAWAHGERGLAAARRLGSERLESLSLDSLARTRLAEGRRREALSHARQAFSISQRSGGIPLNGAGVHGIIALAEPDPDAALAALRQGEALLAADCACHNHFELRKAGMVLSRRRGDWDEAVRHAAAFEAYLGDEPCAYATLWIEGTRLQARLAADPGDREASERLRQVCARAEGLGLAPIARALE
jgi:DNA-binding SARP family transcriptional activator